MLLTLASKSVCDPARGPLVPLHSAPKWAREVLGVYGITVHTSLLAGWDIAQVERLRDDADKAGAPCLLLVEEQPQPLADPKDDVGESSIERIDRVLRVGHRLGCSSIAMSIQPTKNDSGLDILTERLKLILTKAERLEVNVLISPSKGLTETPEQLTTLIRKVGGFRVGSFPDFQSAMKASDPTAYLRALTPYASAVSASIGDFDAKGKHIPYDVTKCIEAIVSVGFEATLSLEYRGTGDPVPALRAARDLIESKASETPDEEVDDEE